MFTDVDVDNKVARVDDRLAGVGNNIKAIDDKVTVVTHHSSYSILMVFTAPSRFRWAFCQLEALRLCLAPRVRHMLKQLPETLDETYERVLRDINKANWDHAHRLLQCLTVAVRPLRVAELAEVLAVDFEVASHGGTSKLNTDWRWEDQQEAVLSTCSSLISVVGEDGGQVVQFSHFSVKEFLTSSQIAGPGGDVSRFHILLEPAHTIIAKACLGVLLRLGELVDEDSVKDKFPLARYAAEHWVEHAQFENVSCNVREGMEQLFDPDKPYFSAWLEDYNIDTVRDSDSVLSYFVDYVISKTATPLYYAALCGFRDLTEQLIIKHAQVSTTGGYYVSPLGAALRGGHLEVAQLLYERGADVDVPGRDKRTLLFGASCGSGDIEIVQWLLGHGANPNCRATTDRWTALHAAAFFGHVEISRLLLQCKADVHLHDGSDGTGQARTPLHVAVQYNRANVARLLLEYGADTNTRNDFGDTGDTSLHLALINGDLDMVRLLVDHGADVYAEDGMGRTAFQVASERGYYDIAKFLSDHGSDKGSK